jgi:hypothetical protein
MTPDDEKVFEVLKQELSEVRTKARLVDDWIFRSLSIAYIPFLVLLLFPYANAQYRIAFLAMPFLSILGLLLHSVFANHYLFCTHYGRYLERRLNGLINSSEILDSKFGEIFYGAKTSILFLSSALVLTFMVVINVALFPVINRILDNSIAQNPEAPLLVSFGMRRFWSLHFVLLGFVGGILGFGHLNSLRKAKLLATSAEISQAADKKVTTATVTSD